jgi:hypothetical protein
MAALIFDLYAMVVLSSTTGSTSEDSLTNASQVLTIPTSEWLFAEEWNVLVYDSTCNICKLEMERLASYDTTLNMDQRAMRPFILKQTPPKFFTPPFSGGAEVSCSAPLLGLSVNP